VSETVVVYAALPVAVAVMLQTVPCGTAARNRPDDGLIPPHEDVQVAGMLDVNCCVCPGAVAALLGTTESGEVTATRVDAAPLPKLGVAVTVHGPATKGAVYRPVVAPIEPQVDVHVATTFEVNCKVEPSVSVAFGGAIAGADGDTTVSRTLAL
jgi:hypothetical protein